MGWMMGRKGLGGLSSAALAIVLAWSGPALAGCEDHFKYEPDARLSVHAISRLDEWNTSDVSTTRERHLTFASFDREGHPHRGDWAAYGLIYAYGGLGERTAGGVLWARKTLDLYSGGYDLKFSKDRGGITMVLAQPELVRLCKRPLTVRMDNEDRLFVNGVQVGKIFMEPGD